MQRRKTFQKNIIINSLEKLCHPSAEEIYEYIIKKYPEISKATIYRNLGVMEKENTVRRIISGTAPERYDINCSRHYHLKCKICGMVEDLDNIPYMEEIDKRAKSLEIAVTDHDIMFFGICSDCVKNKKIK